MKNTLLNELMNAVRLNDMTEIEPDPDAAERLDNETGDLGAGDPLEDAVSAAMSQPEGEGEMEADPMDDLAAAEQGQDEFNSDVDAGLNDEELGAPNDDQNFQGTIRTVRGAALVYKRKDETGAFEELWVFNVGKDSGSDESMRIRKSILAGTDINPSTTQSEDGTQEVKSYSIGNVQFLQINGLPN